MENYARIINDVAVDVSSNPGDQFHPSIASEFQPVPDNVRQGWRLVSGTWTEPESPQPTPEQPAQLKLSPIQFKLLFTAQERVKIGETRKYDAIINDFMTLVEDPRLTEVDLGLGSTIGAIEYLENKALLAPGRKAQILQGQIL